MTVEKKKEKVEKMSATDLLKTYDWCINTFNPLDVEKCESYVVTRNEIFSRLAKLDGIKEVIGL